jgi:hypothetical protein
MHLLLSFKGVPAGGRRRDLLVSVYFLITIEPFSFQVLRTQVDRERQRSKELELRVEELEQKLSKIQTEFV